MKIIYTTHLSRHISTDYGRHGRARVCCVGMLRSECVSIGSPGWLATAGRLARTKPSRTGRPGDRCAMYDVRPPQSLDVSRFSCECVCVCLPECVHFGSVGFIAHQARAQHRRHTQYLSDFIKSETVRCGGGGGTAGTDNTHTDTQTPTQTRSG